MNSIKKIMYIRCHILLIGLFYTLSAFANQADIEKAAELYANKQYAEAAQIYEALMTQGESADLYYNYANARFKMDDLGDAILYYERALVLDPSHSDARFNLDFANKIIVDKIEPIEPFFLTKWINSLGLLLSSNGWAYWSIGLFTGALVCLMFFMFGRYLWLRKSSFFIGVAALLFSIGALSYAISQKNRVNLHMQAIVMSGSVVVKGEPVPTGIELFILHEGTKIDILSFMGVWSEIRTADGSVGWLESSTVERI